MRIFQPYPIQRTQPAKEGWESDNEGFEREKGLAACVESWGQLLLHLFDAKTITVKQISLVKLIISKGQQQEMEFYDGVYYLIALSVV